MVVLAINPIWLRRAILGVKPCRGQQRRFFVLFLLLILVLDFLVSIFEDEEEDEHR